MTHIVTAIAFLILSIIIHIIHCRRSSVGSLQAKAFILIALTNLAIMLVYFSFLAPSEFDLPFTALLLYVLSIPAYLIFYVSTSLMSPSKRILQAIQTTGGANYETILRSLQEEHFITLRLGELRDSGCIQRIAGDKFVLTRSGRNIAVILKIYRLVYGRGAGG